MIYTVLGSVSELERCLTVEEFGLVCAMPVQKAGTLGAQHYAASQMQNGRKFKPLIGTKERVSGNSRFDGVRSNG